VSGEVSVLRSLGISLEMARIPRHLAGLSTSTSPPPLAHLAGTTENGERLFVVEGEAGSVCLVPVGKAGVAQWGCSRRSALKSSPLVSSDPDRAGIRITGLASDGLNAVKDRTSLTPITHNVFQTVVSTDTKRIVLTGPGVQEQIVLIEPPPRPYQRHSSAK
jgi:hypothetical protein